MTDSRGLLGNRVSLLLSSVGYKRRALTWRKVLPDTILVFQVMKNRWGGDQYSFHPSVYIRIMGPESTPPTYRCHVQAFFDRLVPDGQLLERLSDFETTWIASDDRLQGLVNLIATYAVPWLDLHSSVTRLRALANMTNEQRLAQGVLMVNDAVRVLADTPPRTA